MKYPEDRMTGGGVIRFCSSCAEWKPREKFIRTRNLRLLQYRLLADPTVWTRWCQSCHRNNKGYDPLIPVEKIQGVVKAMVEQVGWKEAARRIGVAPRTLSYWLHLYPTVHGKYARRVQARKVAHVVVALQGLKKDILADCVAPLNNNTRRETRVQLGLCVGCGVDQEDYTEGCRQCWDRKRTRERRENPAYIERERAYDRNRR